MNQNELLETLSNTSLHLSKAAVALTNVVEDKSSETPLAARRRSDAKYYRSQILEVIALLDKRIDEVKEGCGWWGSAAPKGSV